MRAENGGGGGKKLDPATKENLAYQEKQKIEQMNNQLKLENRVNHEIFTKNNFGSKQNPNPLLDKRKKSEGDSRLSNFVRGFRRENTDFFPSRNKRHSAVFSSDQPLPVSNNSAAQKIQRSSGFFQRNQQPKGEPILTDFIAKKNSLDKRSSQDVQPRDIVRMRQSNDGHHDMHQLRREKTESVIFVSRNSNQSNQMLQVKADQRTDPKFITHIR